MSVIHLTIQCLIAHWSNPFNSFYWQSSIYPPDYVRWSAHLMTQHPNIYSIIQSIPTSASSVFAHAYIIHQFNQWTTHFCFAFFPSTQVLVLPTHTQILPIHSPTHKHLGNYLDISYAITHPAIIQMWVLHQLCIRLCFMYGRQEISSFLEAFSLVIKWDIILSYIVPSSGNTKTK